MKRFTVLATGMLALLMFAASVPAAESDQQPARKRAPKKAIASKVPKAQQAQADKRQAAKERREKMQQLRNANVNAGGQ
jgi:hypothetical protein